MISRRSGAGVGVLENVLYAVGGHDGPLVRKSCEKYSPDTNTWATIAGEWDFKAIRNSKKYNFLIIFILDS